jgi:hypothetical protein
LEDAIYEHFLYKRPETMLSLSLVSPVPETTLPQGLIRWMSKAFVADAFGLRPAFLWGLRKKQDHPPPDPFSENGFAAETFAFATTLIFVSRRNRVRRYFPMQTKRGRRQFLLVAPVRKHMAWKNVLLQLQRRLPMSNQRLQFPTSL